MPKSKKRKPNRDRNRSQISQHKRTGKQLVPPFIHTLGDKLQTASWMNDRLPEMLWAALILASTERNRAFDEFKRILDFVAGHKRKAELNNLSISGIAELQGELRQEVIKFITDNRETARALSTLTMFEDLPGKDDWEGSLSDFQPNIELLMTAVANTLYHQSPASTDCRWLWTMGVAAAGQLRLNRSLEALTETMLNYPDLEPGAPEGARIRAAEGGLAGLMSPESKWPTAFWQETWESTPCFMLANDSATKEIETATTRQEINGLTSKLKEHWENTHSTTAIDAKHDAMFGMAFYALRVLTEMMAFGTSNGILVLQRRITK